MNCTCGWPWHPYEAAQEHHKRSSCRRNQQSCRSYGELVYVGIPAYSARPLESWQGSPSNVPSITELSDHTGHYGTYRFSISLASVIFRISAEKSWLELQNQLLLQPQAGSTFLSFASFWLQAASRMQEQILFLAVANLPAHADMQLASLR